MTPGPPFLSELAPAGVVKSDKNERNEDDDD